MGIEGGGPRRFIFFGSEGFPQFFILGSPVGLALVKGIWESAPAHIFGEDVLFLWRGGTVFGFNFLQGMERRHVHLVLGFCAASA